MRISSRKILCATKQSNRHVFANIATLIASSAVTQQHTTNISSSFNKPSVYLSLHATLRLFLHMHLSTNLAKRRLQGNWRYRVEDTSHLIGRHLSTLQTADLTALAKALEAKSKLPAFALVDEKDISLAISIAHRGAKDMQVLRGLFTRLSWSVSMVYNWGG